MKHTPGPWEALGNGDVKTGCSDVIMVPGESSEEIRANARLIAAAPDLLEACKYALDHLCACDCECRAIVNRAIGKAEGK